MRTIIENVKISYVSSWLPEDAIEMSSFESLFGEKEVTNIIKTTGIERVRIAKSQITSSDMCFLAALNLIEKGNIDILEIDGLVFVSQTPDYILPATSISLQHRLGLKKETICLDIHYGCSGYIYGALQASLWIGNGLCKNVLVLAGDTTSKLINPLDKSLRMVFGDCGTASLFSSGETKIGFSLNSDGSGSDRLIIPAGGFRMPKTELTSKLEFDVDKNGRTKNDLFMDGTAIFNFAINNVHNDINNLLNYMNWSKESVDFFLLHQANEFMVNYIRKKLKVESAKVPVHVKNFGNTGPATIPFLLSEKFFDNLHNMEKVIMSGFGVGLSWGSIAINLNTTTIFPPVNK